MMAANNMRRGGWDKANDTLKHPSWLYTNKHRGFDSDLIYELKQIANLHFEAIAGNGLAMQAFHFRKADWELVFGNKGTESSNAQAFDGLLVSGVSIETLLRSVVL